MPEVMVECPPARARPDAERAYQSERRGHWDRVAATTPANGQWNRAYRSRLQEIVQFLIPPGRRVLEIGCGRGDLLAAVRPSFGVGIDLSGAMVSQAAVRHPGIRFVHADAQAIPLNGAFDYILMSDLLNDLWDVQAAFEQIARVCLPGSRVVLNAYSRLWEKPLSAARRLGLASPLLQQNWLTVEDIRGLLRLADFEMLRHSTEVLWPLDLPLIASAANKYAVKIWPFKLLALTNVIVARPVPPLKRWRRPAVVSVIVPARNESGNVEPVFQRTPDMGAGTEIVFVEGHSRDETYSSIERAIQAHPERRAVLFRQTGTGKGDAVRLGFDKASGDVLMILDADLTVAPEDLPRFVEALESGKGDFINGVRLVYPMEQRAMRFLNLVGNKFFSVAFSWLLGQPVKDTLCGTKVLRRETYEQIAANRAYFGEFDPFGDFDLLFGAAKLGLKIVDVPIRYGARTYGTTNIQRWRHGVLLLRMLVFAARRLKFV